MSFEEIPEDNRQPLHLAEMLRARESTPKALGYASLKLEAEAQDGILFCTPPEEIIAVRALCLEVGKARVSDEDIAAFLYHMPAWNKHKGVRSVGRKTKVAQIEDIFIRNVDDNIIHHFNSYRLPSRRGVSVNNNTISVSSPEATGANLVQVCDVEQRIIDIYALQRARREKNKFLEGLITSEPLRALPNLSQEQKAVVSLLHKNRAESSAMIGIKPATYNAHIANIRDCFDINTAYDLTFFAYKNQYLHDDVEKITPYDSTKLTTEEHVIAYECTTLSHQEIATVTGLTKRTVQTRFTTIYKKLGITNRHQLIIAIEKTRD